MLRCFICAVVALLLPLSGSAAKPSLAVLNAGVQRANDAPFVTTDYRFFPGDYIYFTFQIAGFAATTENDGSIKKISLEYEVVPQDIKGVPLTNPVKGSIQTTLSPQDKNWIPKRRASFLLPPFVAAGAFHMRVMVKDLIAHTQTCHDTPFSIGGVTIQRSDSITVQNFHFFRTENDREPLAVPSYNPGDKVFARFDMAGFKIAGHNQYHLSYGLVVLRPDGKPYIQQPTAAELQDTNFYPAQFIPGELELTTSANSSRGGYILILTVRDLNSGKSYVFKQPFSLE